MLTASDLPSKFLRKSSVRICLVNCLLNFLRRRFVPRAFHNPHRPTGNTYTKHGLRCYHHILMTNSIFKTSKVNLD